MIADHGPVWSRAKTAAFVDDGLRVAALALDRLDSADPVILVGPAAEIWRALSRPLTEDALLHALGDHRDADRKTVLADVKRFLRALTEHGLAASTQVDTH